MTNQEILDNLIDKLKKDNQETYIAIRVLRALIKNLQKTEKGEGE